MNFDLIQCSVRLYDKTSGTHGNTEIIKAGPQALTPPELLIIRSMHDVEDGIDEGTCSITRAIVVDQVERSKTDEFERLCSTFGPNRVRALFPGGRNMPSTLAACEMPPGCLGPVRAKKQPENIVQLDKSPRAVAARKKQYRKALDDAGVTVPAGNLSESELLDLMAESNLVEQVDA